MKIEQLEMNGRLKNFSYLLISEKSGKAAIIDPGLAGLGVRRAFKKILKDLADRNLQLNYIINTHRHYDHVTANDFIQKKTGAKILSYKTGLRDDDEITIGDDTIKVIETPGHTADGICLYFDKNLFTGDTLFVGDSGATVSPDSNRPQLGESLRKLIQLCPSDTTVWPGHDLGTTKTSTLAREQEENCNSKEYKLKSVSYTGS